MGFLSQLEAGMIGYAVAAALYLILAALLATSWRGRPLGGLMLLAVAVNSLWAIAASYGFTSTQLGVYHVLEVLRNICWYLFLFYLLKPLVPSVKAYTPFLPYAPPAVVIFSVVLLLHDVYPGFFLKLYPQALGFDPRLLGHLILALIGISLTEQIFRNSIPEKRWKIKYLIISIGAIFTYDFYLYANAMLFSHIDNALWQARGFVHALIVPLLAVTAARNPDWSLDVFVSRKVVFHAASVFAAGLILLFLSAVGYFVQRYGGTWNETLRTAFWTASLISLVGMAVSARIRARIKIFLTKHFFNYKYDYREEWLKISRTLNTSPEDIDLRQRVIVAMAEIVDSYGGALWTRNEQGSFDYETQWRMDTKKLPNLDKRSSLAKFIIQRHWIIDLEEARQEPDKYPGLTLPDWLQTMDNVWLLIPLIHADQLMGFIILSTPRATRQINWEDRDLLKTVGLQIAGQLALLETTEALMDARQFEAFNRLSSYVVHDLKNVNAQLALVVSNSRQHKDNPAFVEDAFSTVENAVNKMNRMLAQLRKGEHERSMARVTDLDSVLEECVALRSGGNPVPQLVKPGDSIQLLTDHDKLVNVLSHLLQNAQEATSAEGWVQIRAQVQNDDSDRVVVIEISDNGCGMTEEFIRDKLFRPFMTTKGNAGMGIGAYESREFVLSQGGDLKVESTPGEGTRFTIRLPVTANVGNEQFPSRQHEAVH